MPVLNKDVRDVTLTVAVKSPQTARQPPRRHADKKSAINARACETKTSFNRAAGLIRDGVGRREGWG